MRDAKAFADLRRDPLQLVLVAKTIIRSQQSITEEDISLPPPERREPWSLKTSIFRSRLKEADAKDFFDDDKVCVISFAMIEMSSLTKKSRP